MSPAIRKNRNVQAAAGQASRTRNAQHDTSIASPSPPVPGKIEHEELEPYLLPLLEMRRGRPTNLYRESDKSRPTYVLDLGGIEAPQMRALLRLMEETPWEVKINHYDFLARPDAIAVRIWPDAERLAGVATGE